MFVAVYGLDLLLGFRVFGLEVYVCCSLGFRLVARIYGVWPELGPRVNGVRTGGLCLLQFRM